MPTEKRIKKDAQINLTFGSSFISNLQEATVWVCSLLTPEQSKQLLDMLEAKDLDLNEPILRHSVTLVLLLREIENKAVETQQFVEVEITPDTN